MAKIFYVHWHEAELRARVAPLEAAGHKVRMHWAAGDAARLGEGLPDAVVISLDRLPAHGRHVATWWGQAKKRQGIPIVFAGGKPGKATAVREQFPHATFCAADEVATALARVLGGGPPDNDGAADAQQPTADP